jgi:predicted aspartyl protease
MPVIKSPITHHGPVIDLWVGPNEPRKRVLTKNGFPVPDPICVKALIDTGSSYSAVDPSILQALDLKLIDTIPVRIPMAKEEVEHLDKYVVGLLMKAEGLEKLLDTIEVIAPSFGNEDGIQALIGRDVLSHCKFSYDGPGEFFSLIFEAVYVSHFPTQ